MLRRIRVSPDLELVEGRLRRCVLRPGLCRT